MVNDDRANAPTRILASYSKDSERASDWLRTVLRTLAESAGSALEQQGVEVTFVDASRTDADPAELVRDVDGVLILGGADLHPDTYGQEPGTESLYGVDRHADDFELGLTRAAEEAGLPFLGICRGMQVLNVARGGSLIQDLGPGTIHNVESDNSTMTDHTVRVEPDTLLDKIYATDELTIRSGHHQAVDELGSGLAVSARADDGTIEAIEDPERWTLGVQWHPEDPVGDAAQLEALMSEFAAVSAARRTPVSATSDQHDSDQ